MIVVWRSHLETRYVSEVARYIFHSRPFCQAFPAVLAFFPTQYGRFLFPDLKKINVFLYPHDVKGIFMFF